MGDDKPDDSRPNDSKSRDKKEKKREKAKDTQVNATADKLGISDEEKVENNEEEKTKSKRKYTSISKNQTKLNASKGSEDAENKSGESSEPSSNEKSTSGEKHTLKELLKPPSDSDAKSANKAIKEFSDKPEESEKSPIKSRPIIKWDWLTSSDPSDDNSKKENHHNPEALKGKSEEDSSDHKHTREEHKKEPSSEELEKEKEAASHKTKTSHQPKHTWRHWPFSIHPDSAEDLPKDVTGHQQVLEVKKDESGNKKSTSDKSAIKPSDKADHSWHFPVSKHYDGANDQSKKETSKAHKDESEKKEVQHPWHWQFFKRSDSAESVTVDNEKANEMDKKKADEDSRKRKLDSLNTDGKSGKRVMKTFDAFGAITEAPTEGKDHDSIVEHGEQEIRNWFSKKHSETEEAVAEEKETKKVGEFTKGDDSNTEGKEKSTKFQRLTPGFLHGSTGSADNDRQDDSKDHKQEQDDTVTGKRKWFTPGIFKSPTLESEDKETHNAGEDPKKHQHDGAEDPISKLRDWFRKDEQSKTKHEEGEKTEENKGEKTRSKPEKENPSVRGKDLEETPRYFLDSLYPKISDEPTKEKEKQKEQETEDKSTSFFGSLYPKISNEDAKEEKQSKAPDENQSKGFGSSKSQKIKEDPEYQGIFNGSKKSGIKDKIDYSNLDSELQNRSQRDTDDEEVMYGVHDTSDPSWWATDIQRMRNILGSGHESEEHTRTKGPNAIKTIRKTKPREPSQASHPEKSQDSSNNKRTKDKVKEEHSHKKDLPKDETQPEKRHQDDNNGKVTSETKTKENTSSEEERSKEKSNGNSSSPDEHSEDPFEMWSMVPLMVHNGSSITNIGIHRLPESQQVYSQETSNDETERQVVEGYSIGFSMQYPDPLGVKPPGTRNAFDEEVAYQDPFKVWAGPPYPYTKHSTKGPSRMRSLMSKLRNVLNSRTE